jgi:hypothetical protein
MKPPWSHHDQERCAYLAETCSVCGQWQHLVTRVFVLDALMLVWVSEMGDKAMGLRKHASGCSTVSRAGKLQARPYMSMELCSGLGSSCCKLHASSGHSRGCHGGLRLLMCRINAAVPGAAILRHLRSNSFRKQETALNLTRLLLWSPSVLADCRQCH